MSSAGYNVFFAIASWPESCAVTQPPISLGNDAFDIYSCWTSVPDALVVCCLFYWARWVRLSLSTVRHGVLCYHSDLSSRRQSQHDWSDRWCYLTVALRMEHIKKNVYLTDELLGCSKWLKGCKHIAWCFVYLFAPKRPFSFCECIFF